jgi:hypothetical protein
MDESKVRGLAVALVQNGEVALVRAYGLRDVEAGFMGASGSSSRKLRTSRQFVYSPLAVPRTGF